MKLTIQQMALMSRLLDEALPLDEADRRRWLADLPPEYQDLAEALRAALRPDATKSAEFQSFLEMPPDLQNVDSASGLQPGANVGPYVLLRSLGAGGMAEVWLARRADGAFKREVALKLPLLRQLRQDLAQRFAVERDILASLEHPNIARLYDAGIDTSGCPYLAMEYVRGQPLTDWCDAQSLGLSDRLKLFLQVLEAVRFAHEKQVIHRDLKPSNILVTPAAQVRLLDFGVAKLLEGDDADNTSLTSIYGRALTPDYASPELLRGNLVDVRSDIYSLGVLLYELLTGNRPYRLKSAASMGLVEQAIGTLEIKKPSMLRGLPASPDRAPATDVSALATAGRFGRNCAQSARRRAIEAISECRGLRGRYRTLPRQKTHPGATRANHRSVV
jgi:serine/threonine protein kinase